MLLRCICAATSESELPLRRNTVTMTFTTSGYFWPLKSLDPDYLALKLFTSDFVSSWVISLLALALVLASPVKTRLKNTSFYYINISETPSELSRENFISSDT